VLAGEREALTATWEALQRGASPVAVLRRVAHAAAVRLSRFDASWEQRLDAEVNVLDVTHAVTFAEAAISLAGLASPVESARLALIAAAFVGKLRKADRAEGPAARATGATGRLAEAIADRDLPRSLALAAALDAPSRRAAYSAIAPFAAFDAAVRPIFYAHTVKTTEALRRLDASDPEADGAYLDALLTYLVPRRPEGRARRIAAIATKFLADGRPPVGLY